MSILCSMVGASFSVAAAAEIIRYKNGISAHGGATISTTQSKFGGSSLGFGDGASDYYKVYPNSTSYFGGSGDMTFEFWYWRATTGSGLHITDFRQTGVDGSSWTIVDFEDGRLGLRENGYLIATNFGMPTQTWTHVAIVKQGTTLKFYKNGTLTDTVTGAAATFSNRADCFIGANYADQSAGNNLNGYIDELRISNTARYTANFTAPTSAFVNDNNTLLLIHGDGTNGSTFVEDDNGVRAPLGLIAQNQTQISTAQSQFGGSSILFDGNDDYITVSGMPSLTSNYTLEMWARFDILPWNQTLGGGSYIMLATGGSGDYILINRTGAGSQVSIQVATGNKYGSFTKSGVTLSINTWYHIAVVRNSGVFKVFFNGTDLTTFTNDSGFTNSGRTENMAFSTIGRFIDARGSMDGYIDEIRVSSSARYTGDFTPSTTPFVNDANTVLLIHGDGTNASTVLRDDNGARSQRGIVASGNAQIDTAQSKFGGSSILFDGTGDWLTVDPKNDFNFTTDFTIEFWRYIPSTITNYPVLLSNGQAGTKNGWSLAHIANTNAVAWIQSSDGGTSGINVYGQSGSITTGAWHHIAVVHNNNQIKIYLNGTLSGSTGTVTAKPGTSTGPMYIGYGTGISSGNFIFEHGPIIGHMDEIRISNTARYTANFTAPTAPFQNDTNTLLLIHGDGTDASTAIFDDNGQVPQTP